MPVPRSSPTAKLRRRYPKKYPASLADRSLINPLAQLRTAMDLQELWKSVVTVLDAVLPNYQYVAALPCVEDRPVWISTTVPGSDEPGYWDRFIACEPPLARILKEAPFTKISYLDDFWSEEELSETAFFQKVMQVEGWQYAAGFLFWEGENFVGHIGMNRRKDQGIYLPHERQLLAELYPLVDEAVRRVAAFDAERATRAALEEVLKHQPDGMLILDWQLKPVFQNRSSSEACELWNTQTGSAELPDDIASAAKKLLSSNESRLRQPLPGKFEAPVTDLFHEKINGLRARLRLLHPRAKQAIKPHCLIEFSRVTEQAAVAAFTLSLAERRVAEQVASGKSNPAVASELNLSIHTVRAHLREIFAKLGIQHRSELAAALIRKDR